MTSLEVADRLRKLSREARLLREALRHIHDPDVLKKDPDLLIREYALGELKRVAALCEALAILVESS